MYLDDKTVKTQLIAVALTALAAGSARAALITPDVVFRTSIDTSPLAANATGPFTIDFEYVDGGQIGNNTATLTNFTFGIGGAATGTALLAGDATGSLTTPITFSDSTFFSSFDQTFTPGSSLSFTTDLSTAVDTGAGVAPDQFSFAILDGNGNELATSDPAGTDTILTVNLNSATPAINAYNSTTPALGAVTTSSVPEPTSLAVIGVSATAVLLRRRRKLAYRSASRTLS